MGSSKYMENSGESSSSNNRIQDWLEPLRRHSWEMELLLTGFVLIGLFQLPDHLTHWANTMWMKVEGDSTIKANFIWLPYQMLLIGVKIMTINLIILLLLRGFWIGIIGLSSAFPKGIKNEHLGFADRFLKLLGRESVDNENLIVRLDRICSSVFAATFLFFFIAISIGVFIFQLQILGLIHSNSLEATENGKHIYLVPAILSGIIGYTYLIGGLLKLIDFLTIGLFKKIKVKWFSKTYYVLSQFMSYVTLSIIYRPIYYILVSNFPKKIISIVLIVYIFIAISVYFNFGFSSDHIYYPGHYRNTYELSNDEYENLRSEKTNVIKTPIIQSDVIEDSYLRLFIPYQVNYNQQLKTRCPDLKPVMERFTTSFPLISTSLPAEKSDVEASLNCFSDFYTVSIDDSVYTDIKFLFYRHTNNSEPGIITNIPVDHLSPGFHLLKIKAGDNKNEEIIQFWKY